MLSYHACLPRRGPVEHSAEGVTAFFWAVAVAVLVPMAMLLPEEGRVFCGVFGVALSLLTPPMALAGLLGGGNRYRRWMAAASLPILALAWAVELAWLLR